MGVVSGRNVLGGPRLKKKRIPNVLTVALSGGKKCEYFSSPEKKNIWWRASVLLGRLVKKLSAFLDSGCSVDSGFEIVLQVHRA